MIPIDNQKGSIIVNFSENTTLSVSSAWGRAKLNFDNFSSAKKMTLSNGAVVIGKGIKRVLVYAKVVSAQSDQFSVQTFIRKNGADTEGVSGIGYFDGNYKNVDLLKIIDVEEEDQLEFQVAFSAAKTDFPIHRMSSMTVLEI